MSKMNDEFYKTLEHVLDTDSKTIALVGVSGIGVDSYYLEKYPERFVDVGLMEQSIVGMASGMALAGMIPIIYGHSTFFIERAYEQLKIDFGYQQLGGNFVLYGNSTELGVLGATHCCPAALALLSMIPGMEIITPGRPEEFTSLFLEAYDNGHPTVYRTSLFSNTYNEKIKFGKANIVRKGGKATIIAIGPMLELVMQALADEDVTILYYTTVVPFDEQCLRDNLVNDRLLIVESGYKGGILHLMKNVLSDKGVRLEFVGYPLEFITNHGYVVENAPQYGLTKKDVYEKYKQLVEE